MRPPGFWWAPPGRPGAMPRLLAPLAALTARATARRVARPPALRPAVPVISVGNLTLGGAGKTPTAIALAEMLAAAGHRPAILLRGYGGRLAGPVGVDAARHRARDVGDEALLLAAFAPTFVARDRAAAAALALETARPGCLILDDGHQNPALEKDLSLVVVDAAQGFGNGRCLPAGPLREPVRAGLARADLVLAIGPPDARAGFAATWGGALAGLPVAEGRLDPLATGMPWAGLRVYAFAGIGRPEKFFATLRGLGAELAGTRALDDHQQLTGPLLARLLREAEAASAQLVTTEKDAVRLPAAYRARVLTLPVRLALETPGLLAARLAAIGLAID